MAGGSNLPSSVVSSSCPFKSVTVTGRSLTGQAAVLACQPVTSRSISAEAEYADFWGPATSNGGRMDHAKNTLLLLWHPPVQIPPRSAACLPVTKKSAYFLSGMDKLHETIPDLVVLSYTRSKSTRSLWCAVMIQLGLTYHIYFIFTTAYATFSAPSLQLLSNSYCQKPIYSM